MNLLESAGFSRSNPYYIVKQGKINQMATAPDSQRLKLLREVAGTRVYDERKEESMNILNDTESRLEKIEDLLKYINERLSALETEKEELKKYQELDRERRKYEYQIHNNELADVKKKLEKLQKQKDQSSVGSADVREELQKYSERVKAVAKQQRELKMRLQSLVDEKDSLSSEVAELTKKKANLELTVKDLQEELEGETGTQNRIENELKKLDEKIAKTREQLAEIQPKYKKKRDTEERLTSQLARAEQRRKELYAKQGRNNQFSSKEERDKWLTKELKDLRRAIQSKEEQIRRLKDDLQKDEHKHKELVNEMQSIESKIEEHKKDIDNDQREVFEEKKLKDNLQNERNQLWRVENTLNQEIVSLRDELSKREQNLRSIIGKAILNGIDSINKVLQSLKDRKRSPELIEGYRGTLIENFEVSRQFYCAVEGTAGSKLFYHIVDSDRTGTELLREMNRMGLPGEATFLPMNRVRGKLVDPPVDKEYAIRMIDQLQFDESFKGVMVNVFGKTMICKNLEIASKVAQEHNVDCITMDGDQALRRGVLAGGYNDARRSRLDLHKTKQETGEKLQLKLRELENHRARLNDVDSKLNQAIMEMQRAETKNSNNRAMFEKMKTDQRLKKQELQRIESSKTPKERSLKSLETQLNTMRAQEESYQEELGSDMTAQLSAEDQKEVDKLNDQIDRLTNENRISLKERVQLERDLNKLDNLLNNNLLKKKEKLQQDLEDKYSEDQEKKLEMLQQEFDTINARLNDHTSRLKELDNQIEIINRDQKEKACELEECKEHERNQQDMINSETKELEKIANKQSNLVKKKEECMKKIQELGSLPQEAFEGEALPTKDLYKRLENVNKELKKYSHVNKKALDQYMSFSEQKETLMNRRQEMLTDKTSIKELMYHLDQRKYEAIQLTFKQVSKYFTEIFKKLVPQGHAELVIKKETDVVGGDEDDTPMSASGGGHLVEQFKGVAIRVSFSGKTAEMKDMQQLSGGQKSLVALTLIFAIQKCDPAPFYLFDEIDQALDSQHRKAVADMIAELCSEAQFITTTFRSELLEHADKFYGVLFRNKVSHVECVTREKAEDFLEDDQAHG